MVSELRSVLACVVHANSNCLMTTQRKTMAKVPIFEMGSAANSESACLRANSTWSDVEQSLRSAVQLHSWAIELARNLRCSHPNFPFEVINSSTDACLDDDSLVAFAEDASAATAAGLSFDVDGAAAPD